MQIEARYLYLSILNELLNFQLKLAYYTIYFVVYLFDKNDKKNTNIRQWKSIDEARQVNHC